MEYLRDHLKICDILTYFAFNRVRHLALWPPDVQKKLNELLSRAHSQQITYATLLGTLSTENISDGSTLSAVFRSYSRAVRDYYNYLLTLDTSGARDKNRGKTAEIVTKLVPESSFTYDQDFSRTLRREAPKLSRELAAACGPLLAMIECAAVALELISRIEATLPRKAAKLLREISFPPEYSQAGISILSYFAVYLADVAPDIECEVTIAQHFDNVTMTLTYPDGRQDVVTKALVEYGLVVARKRTPSESIANPLRALALEQKLQLAELEVRQTRDLLQMQNSNASRQIASLEEQVKYLRDLVKDQLNSHDALAESFASIALKLADENIPTQLIALLRELSAAITHRDAVDTRVLLQDIGRANPSVLQKIEHYMLNAATSGVIGNAAYDWLKVLWPILPK